jgi:Tfp pilus assembly protein PilN
MSRPDFSTRGRRAEARTGDLVLLAVAGLALSLAITSAAGGWGDLRRANADLDQARRETQAAVDRARALEGRKGPDAVLSTRAFLTAEAPPQRVLADLETLLPADVRLIALTLDYGDRLDLGLQIAARHAASYDRFLQALQQSPLFTDVRPGEEVRDGGVRAQVQAAYRGGRQ